MTERLKELGLTDEQIAKLVAEGADSEVNLALLSADEIKSIAGCTLIAAKKIAAAMKPAPPAPPEPEKTVTGELPEEGKLPAAEVNAFATSMGIDSNFLSMFLMSNMSNAAGLDMDLSSMMPIPQIVAGYNPKLRNIPLMVMGQIERRHDTPIVVINSDGSVNTELTVKYVMSLEEGFEPAEDGIYTSEDGTPYEIIRVGVDAQSVYDADPLVPTKALPKNGIGTGRVNWNGVSLEVRQVAYYAATQTKELDPTNDGHMSWLRDHIKPTSNRLALQGQCPKAISAFHEAARTGSLPTLRVMLGRSPRKKEVFPRRRPGTPRDLTGIGGGARLSGSFEDR